MDEPDPKKRRLNSAYTKVQSSSTAPAAPAIRTDSPVPLPLSPQAWPGPANGQSSSFEGEDAGKGPTIYSHEGATGPAFGNGSERSVWVCFGMFTVTDIKFNAPELGPRCTPVQVFGPCIYQLPPIDEKLNQSQRPPATGQMYCGRTEEIIKRLTKSQDVKLEFFCRQTKALPYTRRHLTTSRKGPGKHELLVNVFGRSELSDDFGHFFNKADIYLQDPIAYQHDAPYQNPHLLAVSDEPITISAVVNGRDTEKFIAPANIFDQLLDAEELPEADPPFPLRTKLLSHQKQGLQFMLLREQSTCIGGSPQHMWVKSKGFRTTYMNKITGESQIAAPTPFYGGLLADQMGLGKTLQMISLIASDYDDAQLFLPRPLTHSQSTIPRGHKSTLVVLPVSLLQTWQDQLAEHLKPDTLNWLVYHGSKRNRVWNNGLNPHVVLTTYDTVVAEYRKYLSSNNLSVIFKSSWSRLVLDEAHTIRNPNVLRTSALCSIQATSRWAVTGTPIQNRLTDVASLVRFLKVTPFDSLTTFDKHILQPWKERSDTSAVKKLRDLLRAIAIRRSKQLLDLPARDDQIHYVDFSADEQAAYEDRRLRVRDAVLNDPVGTGTTAYPHILRWINDLRGLCSHGWRADDQLPSPCPGKSSDGAESQAMDLDQMGALLDSDVPDLEIGSSIDADTKDECETERIGDDRNIPSSALRQGHEFLSVATPLQELRSPASPMSSVASDSETAILSTKVGALLNDLENHDGKCVIFSFWTKTLDLISQQLKWSGIKFVRLDGRMSHKDRHMALNTFRTQPATRVLLATISVAGVGLDLTVATLVCLLEPQWNPSSEEQALSRVHRMKQTQPVKTIRYVVRNTIEENIVELQHRKVRLAQLALSGDAAAPAHALLEDLKILLK